MLVGDVEDVLRAVAEGADLGVLHPRPTACERLSDTRQQARAVGRDQLHDRPLGVAVGAEIDACRQREMLQVARGAARHRLRGAILRGQPLLQPVTDLVEAVDGLDRRSGIVEHHVTVERVTTARRDDARVDYCQAELLEDRRGLREQALCVLGVDEDLRAAARALLAHRDERCFRRLVGSDQLGVPGDLVGLVAQKVLLCELGPHRVDLVVGHLARFEQRAGHDAHAADALLGVERVLEATP